jgi:protein ImuB
VTPPGQDDALLRRLPAAALGLDAETVGALRRAGLKTIGDLAERPSVLLSARFGEELVRRLARAMGLEDEPLAPLRPPPAFWAERRFPDPMTHQAGLERALSSLLGEVTRRLEACGRGGRLFEAVYFRSDGVVRRIAAETGRPTRDPVLVARLFRERFAALTDPVDPGFGFDALRLAVTVAEPLAERQADLEGGIEGEKDVAALIDRLAARFGRDRVVRFAARDTHDPDRETRRFSALDAAPHDAASWPKPDAREPPLRPLRLLRPPQPVEAIAEFPDGPPARFRWRRVWRDVVRAEGPERIEPEWWREGGVGMVRDYYRIEDSAGRRYWTFRAGSYDAAEGARWFLHGLFA